MKKIYLGLIVVLLCVTGFAQNTASPYSILGIGDIEKSYFDKTSSMGHAGIALTSDRSVLLSNPASLSFLQNPFYNNAFYFDLAVRYKNVNYAGDAIKNSTANQANDLQFKKISIAIKPTKNWGLSFGLLPFSSANYSFSGVKNVQGSTFTNPVEYQGTGSTNLLYLSNSILLAKKLSIGVQTSLLFGQLNTNELIYSAIADSGLTTERNIFLSKVIFKGGFIYKDTLNKDWNYSIGATGSLRSTINANKETTIKNGNSILKNTKELVNEFTSLPTMFTLGVALHYKANYTFVCDWARQNWSNENMSGSNYKINDNNRFSVGLQYTSYATVRDTRGNNLMFEKYFYQAGYYSNNGYLKVLGQNINEWAFTFGAGKQLTANLALQANVEIGSRGTTTNGLIKENFTQVGLSISYRDFWNTKKIKRYN